MTPASDGSGDGVAALILAGEIAARTLFFLTGVAT